MTHLSHSDLQGGAQTVPGIIDATTLGPTLMHEHVMGHRGLHRGSWRCSAQSERRNSTHGQGWQDRQEGYAVSRQRQDEG